MTTQARVQDRYTSLGGLRFHYREWGVSSAPPLLLLHGITGHSHGWDRFAAGMADGFRVLALDQRGHGESGWTPEYSTALMAGDVLTFAQELRLGKFALVGHSMGACNAYFFASQHPELVERLVIGDFGPDVVGSAAGSQVAAGIKAAADAVFSDPEEAVRTARALNPRPAEADVRARIFNNLNRREDGRWVWRYDAAGLAEPGPAGRMPTQEAQWEMLPKITCPTLIVRGAETNTLSRETAERMTSLIPNCQLVEVADAGHSIPLDNPAGWLAALRPFLLEGR